MIEQKKKLKKIALSLPYPVPSLPIPTKENNDLYNRFQSNFIIN